MISSGHDWTRKTGTAITILDFSHLTTEQRLDLIGELCNSIDHDAVPLTQAQAAEIDRRIAILDETPGGGRDAFEALSDLRRRYV